ncbi:hypothetical protein GPECTOR_28g746 [Gonium pectorale]|uniref:Uncharacterized protein n=1 Tax=Gonium pectorale TaxID=33097 RepID=A0A150GG76_GONPE|nr:hypothetical protein GPECTOR_28g746 [Gonium pectorale]|eukprot:KXZ48340.1 hypothetical protein GPECTOR_28g746 [Gonium pectorale]
MDPGDIVGRVRDWTSRALRAARNTRRPTSAPVLVISGLVKTGKSYCQANVVPSLVAEAVRSQGADGPMAGMALLRLNAGQLNGKASKGMGASALLYDLLLKLLEWVREEGVPVRASALQAAKELAAQPVRHDNPGVPGIEIDSLLHAVEVPVLVLCDEVQSLFTPTLGGELDKPGAEYIRDCFMKYLLVHGPRTMLWCITGSSMSQTWVSIAKMPPNGFTVMTSAYLIALPATSSPDHLALVAERLRQELLPHERIDPLLLELCPPSVALLTVLVNEWLDTGAPEDVKGFVRSFHVDKVMEESMKEWTVGLAGMPLAQRLAVLDLTSVGVGTPEVSLHRGLRRFLEPHVDKTADGRWNLRDSHQRQIVRLLIREDGTLRDSWSEDEFNASLVQQDSGWVLMRLGETADYLLGPQADDRWKGKGLPDGTTEFRKKLLAMADEIAEKLVNTTASKLAIAAAGRALSPQELWEVQPWFQKALQSLSNSRSRAWYSAESNRQALDSHLAMLVFYLREWEEATSGYLCPH